MPKNLKRTGAAALDLEKIEEMASKGLTLDQIAGALGIDVRTLYTKRKRFAEVRDAIDRGASAGIASVANALFEAATKQNNTTAQIFFLKARAGWRDQGPIVEINNQPVQQTNVKIDLDVLMGRVNLLRDAMKVLRDLGIPIAQELELPEVDFKALAPSAKGDPA